MPFEYVDMLSKWVAEQEHKHGPQGLVAEQPTQIPNRIDRNVVETFK